MKREREYIFIYFEFIQYFIIIMGVLARIHHFLIDCLSNLVWLNIQRFDMRFIYSIAMHSRAMSWCATLVPIRVISFRNGSQLRKSSILSRVIRKRLWIVLFDLVYDFAVIRIECHEPSRKVQTILQ